MEIVAIAASSSHFDTAAIQAFDQREGLAAAPNWLFLTGSLAQPPAP